MISNRKKYKDEVTSVFSLYQIFKEMLSETDEMNGMIMMKIILGIYLTDRPHYSS